MNRHQQYEGLVALHPRHPTSGEQLRQLPADVVNRGNQTNEKRGICQMMNEKGNDCCKRSEANTETEKTAIEHANDEIESQVFSDEGFGVGQHKMDFIT